MAGRTTGAGLLVTSAQLLERAGYNCTTLENEVKTEHAKKIQIFSPATVLENLFFITYVPFSSKM